MFAASAQTYASMVTRPEMGVVSRGGGFQFDSVHSMLM
jgi:hypothetical protein